MSNTYNYLRSLFDVPNLVREIPAKKFLGLTIQKKSKKISIGAFNPDFVQGAVYLFENGKISVSFIKFDDAEHTTLSSYQGIYNKDSYSWYKYKLYWQGIINRQQAKLNNQEVTIAEQDIANYFSNAPRVDKYPELTEELIQKGFRASIEF